MRLLTAIKRDPRLQTRSEEFGNDELTAMHDRADEWEQQGWTVVEPQSSTLAAAAERMQHALVRIVDHPRCDAQGIAAVALGIPVEAGT